MQPPRVVLAALAIDQPDQRLTAVEYADGADDAAFTLPGPVVPTAAALPTSR